MVVVAVVAVVVVVVVATMATGPMDDTGSLSGGWAVEKKIESPAAWNKPWERCAPASTSQQLELSVQ